MCYSMQNGSDIVDLSLLFFCGGDNGGVVAV